MKEIRAKKRVHKITTYCPSHKLKINGDFAKGEFEIPLVTRELTLLPSLNRGIKAVNAAGGAHPKIISDEMTRSPLLKTESEEQALEIMNYMDSNKKRISDLVNSTSRFGTYTSSTVFNDKNYLYIRLGMQCGDAAGHNMTEKGAHALCEHLMTLYPGLHLVSISSNYCTDKKAAKVNIELGRGKKVIASVKIPEEVLRTQLRTTSYRLAELNEMKNIRGSHHAGVIGQNAHHANIAAAIYAATGQDIANVVESSIGATKVFEHGENVFFEIHMPAIIVGTVSSGQSDEQARENLEALGCYGSGNPVGTHSKKLAEIVASATLAGELSLMAALTNGDELLRAHLDYERP